MSIEQKVQNPFDADEVAQVLSKHKSSSYNEYSGMKLKTLCKRLGVSYRAIKQDKHKIARQLREHPNIESSERAPIKYVSDEQLAKRAERKQRERERKERIESKQRELYEGLIELFASDDRFEDEYPKDRDIERRGNWICVNYKDGLYFSASLESTRIRLDVNPVIGGPLYDAGGRGCKLYVEEVDNLAAVLDAYAEMLRKFKDLNTEMR